MHNIKIEKSKKRHQKVSNHYKILSLNEINVKPEQYQFIPKKVNKQIQIILKIFFIIILYFLYNIDNYITIPLFSKIKACVCVIGKNENKYVQEFINHYRNLGYNHIYIYDNNDGNGEKFEDVLKSELNSNFVSIINYRGKLSIYYVGGPQCLAYKDCYEKHKNEYDWLSFFDFDEFLEVKPHANTIQEFLGNSRFKKCQNIKINFLYYSDNDLLYYDSRPIQERFTTPLWNHSMNGVVKSTVRGGMKENYWKTKCCVHTSYANVTNCNAQGEIIPYDSGHIHRNLSYARLKHYYTKSVEEYVKKTKRGDSFIPIAYNDAWKRKRIKRYFDFNNYTIEKENLFKILFKLKKSK